MGRSGCGTKRSLSIHSWISGYLPGFPQVSLNNTTSSRLLCNYIELFGGIQSFLWGHWSPCLELLVTSGLDFKAGWIPLLYHFWNIYRFPTVFWFLFPFLIFCILESFLFASLKCPNLNTKNSSKANFLSTDTVTDGPPEPKIEMSRYPEDMERGDDAGSVL